jgi:hypothetical protein
MRLLLATFAAALPIPHGALIKIDRAAGYRNFLPTRLLMGFTYHGWNFRGGILRVEFRNKSGASVWWTVAPITGSCDAGKQQSFQLGGNKVWWAWNGQAQFAWRCVFDQSGKPLRLIAVSSVPTNKLAPAGLGIVVAHAKRY